jgi:ribosomal protein L11 methyltransferase
VADLLVRQGARGAWENDGEVVAYLPEPPDPEAEVTRIREALSREPGVIRGEVTAGWQDHEEWSETWKRGLGPRRVVEGLVVSPSWCDPGAGPGERVLVLDPGMAFGTAEHGTTRGCLRLLADVLSPGDRIFDVGAGSGILSVAAALLGAGSVLALEADPWAAEAARENVIRNGVAGTVTVEAVRATAAGLRARGAREGVLANIEAGVLTPLLPGLRRAVAPDGWLILSGVPTPEWEPFQETVEEIGLQLRARDEDDGWTSGRFTRRGC